MGALMENYLSLVIKRTYRRHRRKRYPVLYKKCRSCNPLLITLLLAAALAAVFIGLLEVRLRPVAEQLAGRQVNNLVTARLNAALSELSANYSSLVEIQRSADGTIAAVTANMEQMNRIRSQAVQVALDTIANVDVHTLGIPLGSLFDFDLLWAKGPDIGIHSLVAGTVSTEVHSDFQSAGINQTLHRIMLDVEVPLTVLLPGSSGKTQVSVSVCVAETVIVGQVPQTYLNLGGKERGRETGSGVTAAGAGAGRL